MHVNDDNGIGRRNSKNQGILFSHANVLSKMSCLVITMSACNN